MVKRLALIFFAGAVFLQPPAIHAQAGGLTMPGSVPTLAPLSAPLNNLIIPQTTPPPAETTAPLSTGTIKPAPVSKFSVTKIIAPYVGTAYKALAKIFNNIKLDGVAKTLLIDLSGRVLEFVKNYNARLDPLISKFLTDLIARLPDSFRGFTKVFIPFLTMAGKVILGVIAAIVAMKIAGFILGRLFSSLFRRKRRRR